MNKQKIIKEIQDLIFEYKDIANSEEKTALSNILEYELNLIKNGL